MQKKSHILTTLFTLLFLLVAALFWFLQPNNFGAHEVTPPIATQTSPTPDLHSTASSSAVLGAQTRFSGCKVEGAFPDSARTPGAVLPNVTKEDVCTPGYAQSVRNVPEKEKQEVYSEYGIAEHKTGEYEVDHHVSLELGGSNDLSNLWPEAAEPTPGFHQKDKVENFLHKQVCDGVISLQEAQQKIATDWLSVYQTLP
jgi:hypothetical protein